MNVQIRSVVACLAASLALALVAGCSRQPSASAASSEGTASPAVAVPIKPMRSSAGADDPQASPVMPPGHPPVGGTGSPVAVEKTPPPAGGLAIAAVWASREALAGKTVTVGGTVVKFNGGILGTNWLHVRDGSGSEADGTHDLTVTTLAEAKPGDIVTASGTLAIDKDFGSGYRYAVILENATLRPR